MVAYSFSARFRAPIVARTKFQTIRSERKRHARWGETLQLYTGVRTKQCALIGTAVCAGISSIRIYISDEAVEIDSPLGSYMSAANNTLDAFAVRDGFRDWSDMRAFWMEMHPDAPDPWSGVLIRWREFRDG